MYTFIVNPPLRFRENPVRHGRIPKLNVTICAIDTNFLPSMTVESIYPAAVPNGVFKRFSYNGLKMVPLNSVSFYDVVEGFQSALPTGIETAFAGLFSMCSTLATCSSSQEFSINLGIGNAITKIQLVLMSVSDDCPDEHCTFILLQCSCHLTTHNTIKVIIKNTREDHTDSPVGKFTFHCFSQRHTPMPIADETLDDVQVAAE